MKDDEVVVNGIYRVHGIEGDKDLGGHKAEDLNGVLIRVIEIREGGHHFVRLEDGYENRWMNRKFYLTADHMEDLSPPSPQEIEAAKQRTTEILNELQVLRSTT